MLRPLPALFLLLASALPAQTFQLVMCELPNGSGGLQPIERYLVAGTNGAMTRISDIAASWTNDPACLAFDNRYELFVANRAGHSGNGSVSRFTFDAAFGGFTPHGTITGNGLVDGTQLAFNPLDGEMFVGNWGGPTVSRFTFDAAGNAVANGTVTMPDPDYILGLAIRAADQQLLVGSYSLIRRFARQPNGSYAHLGNFTIPGAAGLHFMAFRGDELYVAAYGNNLVHRITFDAAGAPMLSGSVPVSNPISVAFSPDRNEMYVARHTIGGIQRLLYQPATDSWTPTALIPTPSAGGIAVTQHMYSSYGTGCAGTGAQEPILQGYGSTRPGSTAILRTQLGAPNALGTILFGLQAASAPVMGCTLLTGTILGNSPLFFLDATGRNDFAIPVPAGLAPIDLYFQTYVLDLGAPNGLFSNTAGLRASPL